MRVHEVDPPFAHELAEAAEGGAVTEIAGAEVDDVDADCAQLLLEGIAGDRAQATDGEIVRGAARERHDERFRAAGRERVDEPEQSHYENTESREASNKERKRAHGRFRTPGWGEPFARSSRNAAAMRGGRIPVSAQYASRQARTARERWFRSSNVFANAVSAS